MAFVTPNLSGRLGNFLFQIACSYAISRDQGKNLVLTCDPHKIDAYREMIKIPIQDVKIDNTFVEGEYEFTSLMSIPSMGGNLKLVGYFQNEKYFDKYRNDILNMFSMSVGTKKYLTNKYPHLDNAYFIHIRRGDYLHGSNESCPFVRMDYELYLEKALSFVDQNAIFYVGSDDPTYCQGLKVFTGKNVTFLDENDLNTLYAMSLCRKGGICSNSTFGWWGFYLIENEKKIGIFPEKWYQNGLEKVPSPNPANSIAISM